MIRRVALLLFVAVLVLGTSLTAQAERFRHRRTASPGYNYYVPARTAYPPIQGYEYQNNRYEARTTVGYTMLFGI